jgi:putative nucleotidyltransferase with HDIG domain
MVRSNLLEKAVERGLRMVPPFPPIAARLLVLLASESVSLNEVADLIGSDPTFSARLLHCVNSAAFALTTRVGNVHQALVMLGLDRTRQITVTVATAAYAQGAMRSNELRRCWEHTVATAILADQIAHACGGAFNDIAYTAGIMHDIGRLGLLVVYPREYERIIRDAAAKCHDLLDFEREQFGMDHAEAGRILAERWKLPEEFRLIAGRHHDPCEGEELDLLRIVHAACRLADALGYDVSRPLAPLDVDEVLEELPPPVRGRLTIAPDEMRALIEQRIRSYDGGGDEADTPPGDLLPVHVPATSEPFLEAPYLLPDPLRIGRPQSHALLAWVIVVLAFVLLGLSAFLRFR